MKKVLVIGCATSFVISIIFCSLALLAWIERHPLFPAVTIASLLALAFGFWIRQRLAALKLQSDSFSATESGT